MASTPIGPMIGWHNFGTAMGAMRRQSLLLLAAAFAAGPALEEVAEGKAKGGYAAGIS